MSKGKYYIDGMSNFTPPKFTLANSIESDYEWIYHNRKPRAIIAIRADGDPELDVDLRVKTETGEELGVIEWIDPAPDETAQKKLLADAVGFLDEFSEAAFEEDE